MCPTCPDVKCPANPNHIKDIISPNCTNQFRCFDCTQTTCKAHPSQNVDELYKPEYVPPFPDTDISIPPCDTGETHLHIVQQIHQCDAHTATFVKGEKGDPGPPGPQGIPGEKGEPGDFGASAYSVEIISVNGTIFKNGKISTILIAVLRTGAIDITATLPEGRFVWTRKSDDAAADEIWNHKYFGGRKQIQITTEDVYNRATFYCTVTD